MATCDWRGIEGMEAEEITFVPAKAELESGSENEGYEEECDGHLAVDSGLPNEAIGAIIYCDGSCKA